MARVSFTPHLRRHVDCPTREVAGDTVRTALEAVFADNRTLQSYVLDDQQRLRKHVVVFIDGCPIVDRTTLGDAVAPTSEIYVMQALSGG